MQLGNNWAFEIVLLLAAALIGGVGFLIRKYFFSPKPRIQLLVQQNPVPNLKSPPEDLKPWVYFDTGARNGILRLENTGDARAVFHGIALKRRNGKCENVGAIVHESKRSDWRFEPYVLEPNTACTVEAGLPDDAFVRGNMLLLEFIGLKRPIKYKIPERP